MTGRLQDRIAIVTGAGSVGPGWGNGRATAVRFAQEGAKVFAVDKDAERLSETLEKNSSLKTLSATCSTAARWRRWSRRAYPRSGESISS